ncbi:MAG: ABC transporter permease [Syntrophomonadaceae bacterium]
MNFRNAIGIAVRAIIANKMRSFLTMLGVIIGVSAVIILVAIGQGSSQAVKSSIESMGSNLLILNIMGRNHSLTYTESLELSQIDGVKEIAAVVRSNVMVKNGSKTLDVSANGINGRYLQVCNYTLSSGRNISSIDIENRSKVAIVGAAIVNELYQGREPTGQTIKVNGSSFTIIGVLQPKGSSLSGSSDETLLMPLSTAQRFLQSPGIRTVYVQAEDAAQVNRVQLLMESEMAKKFDQDSIRVFNQTEMLDTVDQVTRTMSAMLGGIAAISLVVGGIGIMNIMLVSVMERIAEIGIRKAIGAKRRDILYQFLVESAAISGMGGVLGIGVGIGGSYIINTFWDINCVIPVQIIFLAFLVSLGIGIFFGIFPANRAAKLSPVDALREE